MNMLVFHRVGLFANALASHISSVTGVAHVDVVTTEVELGSQFNRDCHDVVLFTRSDMFRCLTQWQRSTATPTRKGKLVMLVPVVFPQLIAEARPYGVSAVVDANVPVEQLVTLLRDVAAGTVALPEPDLLEPKFEKVLNITPQVISYHDATDIEIVRLLAMGLVDKKIAAQVHLSNQTVRNRISRILVNSDIDNRTQLTSCYMYHQFVQLLT